VSIEAASPTHGTVRIERPATGGGVGRMDDGKVIFVRHSLPGELVDVEVTERTANFYRGEPTSIIEASRERVAAPCSYARPGGCGGCDLQHASTEAQRSWKTALVEEHLKRIAGVEMRVTLTSANGPSHGSRTRLRCAVDEHGHLSLRKARSHNLVAINDCWISDDVFTPAFGTSWDGAEEVELRAIGNGEPFAVVKRDTVRGTMYEVCSLLGEPLEPSTHSRVDVFGHVFSVGPRSFWQSHRDAPNMLLPTVLEFADAQPGDHVTDLFSGVGLFSVPLAKVVGPGGKVTAVESSPYAVRDARENGDGLRHLKVREWSVSPRAINDSVGEGDIVVLDPPRHGMAKGVADSLVRRAPRRVVYVSCDAATFARDLKHMLAGGFQLSDLKVFDLFPMTQHSELVALLDMAP
jgi:tRNA/tmRNA/rRNA uracil-C5-methylase (TrmA/RlmC/RlmD family)